MLTSFHELLHLCQNLNQSMLVQKIKVGHLAVDFAGLHTDVDLLDSCFNFDSLV